MSAQESGKRGEEISRRGMIVGAAGLFGGGLLSGCGPLFTAPEERDGAVFWREGVERPLYLGPEGTKDPAQHSRIENLFWLTALAEHADFFAMLMPGADLDPERSQAQEFQDLFVERLDRARGFEFSGESYARFNRESADLAKRFRDWKLSMHEAQISGKLQTLVWSSFFRAAAREADRFARRLEQYNGGAVELDRKEVVEFWSQDTSGHLAMIGHLLDPEEKTLVARALEMSERWKKIDPQAAGDAGDPILEAEQEVIDFKTSIAKGVETAKIQSILHPAMVDHMKREGLRFIDELKRSA